MTKDRVITKTTDYGGQQLTIETGRLARQAGGSVLVTLGDTSVLATATVGNELVGASFMPLTVHYQERFYATGRIPGGFFRREGRPSEKETLISRLIDRSLRPLFASGFHHEVLVTCTVMSLSPDVDGDIPAMIGASAALTLLNLPWSGPIGAVRVGYRDGKYCLNPMRVNLTKGDDEGNNRNRLDMTVGGTEAALLMVESEADELSEEQMLGAALYGHEQMQPTIKVIHEMAKEVGNPAFSWNPPSSVDDLVERIRSDMGEPLEAACQMVDKKERLAKIASLNRQAGEQYVAEHSTEAVKEAFRQAEKKTVRARILNGQPRLDGRDMQTVRPIAVEVGVLPRTHGSALFTRGNTQAIGTVTLGSERDAQMIDLPEGKTDDAFMLHYNFPPYSVGEAGRMAPPGRREIGHGRLARRALAAMLPNHESFPYTVRVVSEITESNGSSSMASVCVGSLALMDAGVPIRKPVAGVAMGLVKEGSQFVVLTDILGDEDHLGDMDFKVAGTEQGINALQMDIKIQGIDAEIMKKALEQARDGRLHILGEMAQVLKEPRSEVAEHAPSWKSLTIPVDKIRELIGKGGENIRAITTETETNIDVGRDGSVRIYGETRSSINDAVERIKRVTAEVEVGMRIRGEVMRITDFGAFVNIQPGKDGLVHISEIADRRIDKVEDHLTEGEMVDVKVIGIDDLGRVKLSIKQLEDNEASN